MSDPADSACERCLRRSWLLAELSALLDIRARSPDRLDALLDLDDARLIEAIAGSRREQVRGSYEQWTAPAPSDTGTLICVHDPSCPAKLRRLDALGAITASCTQQHLGALLARPVVVIAGSGAPTDYGEQTARDLAAGLTAAGATVAAVAQPGIAEAALRGALAAGGSPLVAARGGIASSAGLKRSFGAAIRHAGCLLSMLPANHPPSRWVMLAGARALASTASLTLVVEAGESAHELFAGRAAAAHGGALAAVPGRVGSPLSSGCHLLIRHGATLVRGAGDVLDLLHLESAPTAAGEDRALEPRLAGLLSDIGAGCDTLPAITGSHRGGTPDLMSALGELELMGLVGRGDGGRYLLRDPGPVPSARRNRSTGRSIRPRESP